MTQRTCFMVPTWRPNPHHSQTSLDPVHSLVVKPLGPKKTRSSGIIKDCWTPEISAPRFLQKSARPVLIRESTEHSTYEPWARSSKDRLPVATATVPRTGLIKLTSATSRDKGDKGRSDYYESHHINSNPFRMNRPKKVTSSCTDKRMERRTSLQKPVTLTRNKTYYFGMLNSLTVDDLRVAINSKYPETNGVTFSRASTFLKETTTKPNTTVMEPVPSQEGIVNSYLKATEPPSFDTGRGQQQQKQLTPRRPHSPPNTPQSMTKGGAPKEPLVVTIMDPGSAGEDLQPEGSLPERHYSHSIDESV